MAHPKPILRGSLWVKRRIDWPEDLRRLLGRAFPHLGVSETVALYRCHRLPFDWLPGDRSKYSAMTLWNSVFLREGCFPPNGKAEMTVILLHELVHVEQFRRNPVLFPLKYLLGLMKHGYADHPAEIEARDRGASLLETIGTTSLRASSGSGNFPKSKSGRTFFVFPSLD